MPRPDGTETFTEMRDRLMEVHGWDRKIATIAARYYMNVESSDDIRARTQFQQTGCGHCLPPDLSVAMAHEIAMLR